jgi:hypothetical protein
MPLVATVDRTQDPLMAKLERLAGNAPLILRHDITSEGWKWTVAKQEAHTMAWATWPVKDTPLAAVDAALEECDGLSK